MKMKRYAFLLAATLAACGSEPPQSVAVATPQAVERIGIRYSEVFVREVSLPSYAAAETIFLRGEGGLLTEDVDSVWADDPSRAVTLGMAQALQTITRARVAPEPWPFSTNPEVAVDIRIETFAPGTDGVYRAEGQVFIAPEANDEGVAQNRALSFRLSARFDLAGGQSSIGAARSNLVGMLAADIARRGLR